MSSSISWSISAIRCSTRASPPNEGAAMRLRANAAIGGALIGILALTAATAALWTPYDPLGVNLRARLQPPSALHLLGTDEFGRDVLSRIMAGVGGPRLVALLTHPLAASTLAAPAVLARLVGALAGRRLVV